MRGSDTRSGELFSYVDLEKRVPAKHPLRFVRSVVNDILTALDGDFAKAYAVEVRVGYCAPCGEWKTITFAAALRHNT